jgi:YfiH family protein
MGKVSILPDSDIPFFTEGKFASDGIFHGFFGRKGGVSSGLYGSLNCGIGSNDERSNVIENRKLIAQASGVAAENFLSVHQIHSTVCQKVTQAWPMAERPQGDAMVTDVPGIALAILTADCVPTLFHGKTKGGKPVIGAAHAGWGGALKGILESTVQAMRDLGAEEIKAVIGPCICKASYEVSGEFVKKFMAEDEENERFFTPGRREDRPMFDLPGYCAAKLAKAGLNKVYLTDIDTYANEADFFSFRRTTHRQEPDYGRQVSVIAIKNT